MIDGRKTLTLNPPLAGAQRKASELGVALVSPDTSPRGLNIPGEADSWDFGVGAGFYLNATVRCNVGGNVFRRRLPGL